DRGRPRIRLRSSGRGVAHRRSRTHQPGRPGSMAGGDRCRRWPPDSRGRPRRLLGHRVARVSRRAGANLPGMEDFPARLAAFLEDIATRVRAMTVDRAAKAVRLTSLGFIAAAFGLMAAIVLFLTIHEALASLLVV